MPWHIIFEFCFAPSLRKGKSESAILLPPLRRGGLGWGIRSNSESEVAIKTPSQPPPSQGEEKTLPGEETLLQRPLHTPQFCQST
ncbi:Uncharacterised protein [Campylobacter jejuni]|nr:Uncharacterised protein [Campylobacter jejuni]